MRAFVEEREGLLKFCKVAVNRSCWGTQKKKGVTYQKFVLLHPLSLKLDIIGGACAHLQTVVVVNAMVRGCGVATQGKYALTDRPS